MYVAWVADRAGQQQHAQQQHVPRLQVGQDVGAALAGRAAAEDARGEVIGCLVGPLHPVVDLVRVRVRVSGHGQGLGLGLGLRPTVSKVSSSNNFSWAV